MFATRLFLCVVLLIVSSAARADIYRWDTGDVIPGTEGIEPGPGVLLDHRELEYAKLDLMNLTNADFESSNVARATFYGTTLLGANLTRSNLANVDFGAAVLTDTILADAIVSGAFLYDATARGLTNQQLYSTSSYKAKHLGAVWLDGSDLSGWDFNSQDLASSHFTSGRSLEGHEWRTHLDGTDFSGANLEGAQLQGSSLTATTLTGSRIAGANLIMTNVTKEQLYSTASYLQKNLRGILISGNDLTNGDFSGQDLTGAFFGSGRSLAPATLRGANLENANISAANFNGSTSAGFTKEQLYSTASYKAHRLIGVDLEFNDLTGWDFHGQDLSDTELAISTLAGADFSEATLFRTNLGGARGLTAAQLYATASYKDKRLEGVALYLNDLTGWDFQGQYLVRSVWHESTLTGADFTGTDLRSSNWMSSQGGILRNTIQPDGRVQKLELLNGDVFDVRDDDGDDRFVPPVPPIGIIVMEQAKGLTGSVLRLTFESDPWNSLISFEPGIPVELAGTLELTFADDVDMATQVGRTIRIFDWTGVEPNGAFRIASRYRWDTRDMYTSGEVTLTAVPEPSAGLLMIVTAVLFIGRRVAGRLRSKALLGLVAVGALTWIAPARCETFTLSEATVVDINHAFDSGVLTSEKLVQLYLNRIEAYDDAGPQLNSFIALNSAALQTARVLDQERRTSGPRSPLHGIPIVLKDNVDTFDMPTTYGCLALEGSIPPDDAFLVKRLRDAGAIILGKTNLDEFGAGLNGRSSLGGQTRNAYDPNRVPLGSSGGTGVAVSANLTTLGFGADAIGSVRMPSSASSLVGLKPTLGLVSRDGIISYDVTREMAGPMARTVADVAIALDVVAGYDPADPTTAASQGHIPPSYLDSLHIGSLQQAKLGKVPYVAVGRTNPMRDLSEAAYQDLQGLGAELTGPVDVTFMPDWYATLFDSFEYDLNRYLESLGPAAPVKSFDELVASGKYLPSLDGYFATVVRGDTPYADDPVFLQLMSQRDSLRQQLIGIMDSQGLDALVYPTFPREPALTSVEDRVWTEDYFDNMTLAAFLGLPAITVPAGFTPEGLPLGIEFLGRPFSEPTLLGFAYDYEQATKHRHPPASTPTLVGETMVLGDTNSDGVVDLADLNNVRNNFGATGLGDTNGDQVIDLVDLNNVRNQFGQSIPQAVPEPSSSNIAFALVVLIAGPLMRLRKH